MPRTTQEGKHVVDVVKEYPYADSAVWFIKVCVCVCARACNVCCFRVM